MRLSTGIYALFVLSCVIALLTPLIRNGLGGQLRWEPGPTGLQRLKFGLPVMLVLYGLAAVLKLDAAGGILYFVVAYAAYWALSCLKLESTLRGIILLLAAFFWFPLSATNPDTLPLLSYFFGLLTARLSNSEAGWEDFTLPATLLIGQYWLTVSAPENWLPIQMGLLLIFLSLSLLLRTVSTLPVFPTSNAWLRPLFLTVTGGLAAWLAVQSLLTQPGLLTWAWLFTGGLALAFVLAPSPASEDQLTEDSLLAKIIFLVLIGLMTLVASRLYGTLGWLVLAAAMAVNPRLSTTVAIAALFFLSRSLVQGFIFEFNSNVTGINITHVYAGAALYVGFIAMMLIPAIANRMAIATASEATAEYNSESAASPIVFSGGPLSWTLVLAACILAGGLANYFLHAEAASSLMVALTVGGLGAGMLGAYRTQSLSVQPLLFSMLVTGSAMLTSGLIAAGNESDKGDKMTALTVAMILYGLIFWLMQRKAGTQKLQPAA